LLGSLANEYSEVYIVIDALDECIEDSGQLIWSELLSKLKDSLPNLRLLYTSRNIHDTTGVFTESTVIPIRASELDIRTYIKSKCQTKNILLQFFQQDPTLQNDVLEAIASKAEGM
jgi:hypothetical protein